MMSAFGAQETARAASGSTTGGPECELVANGSFDDELEGWAVDEVESVEGDGSTGLDTRVDDASGWFPWLDDHVFGAEVEVISTGKQDAGFGEVVIDVRLSRQVEVIGSTLRFIIGGGGEVTWWGEPEVSYTIELEIEDDQQQIHTVPVLYHLFDPSPAFCEVGVSLVSFYNHPIHPAHTEIDLLDVPGIEIGDEVTVTIRYRIDAIAPTPCDQATYFGTFLVDNISFCDLAPPADLDGDGEVGVSDLLIMLASWGGCADCPADLNGDGIVDVSDLLALLAAWDAP
jgi:hypothetical protein